MPSRVERPLRTGVCAIAVLLLVGLYAQWVEAACGCFTCASGSRCLLGRLEDGSIARPRIDDEGLDPEYAGGLAPFRIENRWGTTASHFARSRGTPITLTWGIVPDGTTLPSEEQDDGSFRRDPSDLVSFFDARVGTPAFNATTSNLELKTWFPIVKDAYDRWAELSGITFTYEPNDDGAPISGLVSPSRWGVLGTRADMRLSGHFIDGQTGANTVAYNYFPSAGDMVIDTSNTSLLGRVSGNYRALRNVLTHEIGHGIGFRHLESSDSRQLMEPFIDTRFDGPQIDDILAVQRSYGDALEKNGGNDSATAPTELGTFTDGDAWGVGRDGRRTTVARSHSDFVSIDGSSDFDFYGFRVAERLTVDITLTQVGDRYEEGPQNGAQQTFDASRQNPLTVSLISRQTGQSFAIRASGIATPGSDIEEAIQGFTLSPNEEYVVRVFGSVDRVQLYDLQMSFAAIVIPEPATALVAALGLVVAAGRRGSRRRIA